MQQSGPHFEKKPTQELEMAGLEATSYKTWRLSRKTLELARRTAIETRITMALATVAVCPLILAIYMLWRVLEHLPKI